MAMRFYQIRVRLSWGIYDTHYYKAHSINEAMEMMRKYIWEEYKCFNPEVIHIKEV
jgi:hypothetical protein